MALGTGIALLPERAFAFATAKIPAGRPARRRRCSPAAPAADGRRTRSTSRRAEARRTVAARTPLEKEIVARAHLHVRHVRASKRIGDFCCHGRDDARRSRRVRSTGQDARGDLSIPSSPTTAARSRSARRSTRASTGWPGCSPTWSARRRRRVVASPPMRWSQARAGAARGRRRRTAKTPLSRRDWMMSSATSTSDGPAEAGHTEVSGSWAPVTHRLPERGPARRPSGLDVSRVALLRAGVADGGDRRGHHVPAVHARTSRPHQPDDRVGGPGRGRLLSHDVAACRRRVGHGRRGALRARAGGARAREGPGAAGVEGSRVRSLDGEGVAGRLRRDGGAAADARAVAHEAARRGRHAATGRSSSAS